jgi:hypothetical protein
MQKQAGKNYKKYKGKSFKKLKLRSLYKRYAKNRVFGRPFKKYRRFLSKKFLKLSVTVTPNNIFCSLKHNKGNFTLKAISSGIYKIKTTRKRLKYNTKTVLNLFFRDLKQKKVAFSNFIVISVVAPIKIRKQIINLIAKSFLKRTLRKKRILFDVPQLKAFNGCRAIKKQRKKRKGFKLYK